MASSTSQTYHSLHVQEHSRQSGYSPQRSMYCPQVLARGEDAALPQDQRLGCETRADDLSVFFRCFQVPENLDQTLHCESVAWFTVEPLRAVLVSRRQKVRTMPNRDDGITRFHSKNLDLAS